MQPIAKESPVSFATPQIDRLPVRCLIAAADDHWVFHFPSLACLKYHTTTLSILPAPVNIGLLKRLLASSDEEFLAYMQRNLSFGNSVLCGFIETDPKYEWLKIHDRLEITYLIPPWDLMGNETSNLCSRLPRERQLSRAEFHYGNSVYTLVQVYCCRLDRRSVAFDDIINACKKNMITFLDDYQQVARVAPVAAEVKFLVAFNLEDNSTDDDDTEIVSSGMYVFARKPLSDALQSWSLYGMSTAVVSNPIASDDRDQTKKATATSSVFDWLPRSPCQIV
jgi:hypothetical protein